MHKLISGFVFLVVLSNFASAQVNGFGQKIGHIDSEYILSQLPDYQEKKKELETLAKSYDKEVRSLYDEAAKMEAKLKAEEVLLTPAMIEQRKEEIADKQEQALQKNTEIFGYEGLYYKKVDELMTPLRSKLNLAVEVIVKKNGLDYMFDKAADVGILYSNPVHDYTEFVLEELGVQENKRKNED